MASSRNVIIAGAGIGGLSAALMLARSGFRVTLLEQAERLEETGAGIQLSPNATRILIALGLGERLRADVFVPEAVAIKTASGGRLARIPLGDEAERRYGAPYWAIHRADLQAALLEAVRANPDIVLRLGTRVEDFVLHANGLSVACRRGAVAADEHGIALIGADGLWSGLRARLGQPAPEFRQRTAWRALVPADAVEDEFRAPDVQLWLGPNAHVVHYPVKGGALINIVAIVNDDWAEPGWSAAGRARRTAARITRSGIGRCRCASSSAVPERWQKWALYDVPPFSTLGRRPGDAARGRRPPDAAVPRPGRGDGDRGCGGAGRPPGARARTIRPRAMRRYERARRQAHGAGAARGPQQRAGLSPHRGRGVGAQSVSAGGRRKDAAAPLQLAL